MRNETPKDRAPPSASSDAANPPEQRDSMAMDLLDTPGGDGTSDGLGFENGGDGGTMLLPHERKLPISEQRRIIAARKHHDDGIDEDDSLAMGGRRGRGRRRQHADQAHERGHRHGHGGPRRRESEEVEVERAEGRASTRKENEADAGKASGGGTARAPVEKTEDATAAASGSSGSSGGSRIERESDMAVDATPADPRKSTPTAGDTVRLDDPAHPHAPLYGAALKAVAELAPAQAAMGPAEQANIAAALTARMAGDATFAQQLGDASRLSFGLGQNGDRLFAINHPVPDAPNAVHVSVDLQQARALPIEASSGHVEAGTAHRDPAQAIESPVHEHAPRQS